MSLPSALYLGPLGGLVTLPIPDTGWTNEETRMVGGDRTLSGSLSPWVFGVKSEIGMRFTGVTEREVTAIRSMYTGVTRGPFYFVNPLVSNRMPRWIAATGSAPGDFLAKYAGTASGLALDTTGPDGVPVHTGVKVTSTSGFQVPTQGGGDSVPTAPSGETLTASFYYKATGVATLGVYQDQGSTSTHTNYSLPVAADYTLHSETFTVPAGVDGVRLTVAPASGQTVTVSAIKLGNRDTDIWTPGGGSIKVDISQFSVSSPQYPLYTVDITLREL